jgi:hypothetical protein
MNQNENPQNIVFQVLDAVPSQLWYVLGIGSILTSLTFQAIGKENWADFVGKWPPTFLLIGLYHKLLRPGNEDATGQASNAARQFGELGDEFSR